MQKILAVIVLAAALGAEFARASEPFTVLPAATAPQTYIASTENGRLVFRPPRNWALANNQNARKVFIRDVDALITITFLGPKTSTQSGDSLSTLLTLKRDAELVEEFTVMAAGASAAAADVNWVLSGAPQSGRYVSAVLPLGTVQFTIECPAGKFAEKLAPFMQLLASAQALGPDERPQVTSRGTE